MTTNLLARLDAPPTERGRVVPGQQKGGAPRRNARTRDDDFELALANLLGPGEKPRVDALPTTTKATALKNARPIRVEGGERVVDGGKAPTLESTSSLVGMVAAALPAQVPLPHPVAAVAPSRQLTPESLPRPDAPSPVEPTKDVEPKEDVILTNVGSDPVVRVSYEGELPAVNTVVVPPSGNAAQVTTEVGLAAVVAPEPVPVAREPDAWVNLMAHGATMRVETPQDGTVAIRMHVRAGVANVHFAGGMAETLGAHASDLRVALTDVGLGLGGFGTSDGQRQSHQRDRDEPELARGSQTISEVRRTASRGRRTGVHVKA
ncbi:MAG: hypothetical protein AB2A00_03775 [Myxococcota bacterium]